MQPISPSDLNIQKKEQTNDPNEKHARRISQKHYLIKKFENYLGLNAFNFICPSKAKMPRILRDNWLVAAKLFNSFLRQIL